MEGTEGGRRRRSLDVVVLVTAPAEGSSGDDVETLDAINIDQFGLEGPERIPCLGIRHQIAQKLHACIAPPLEGRVENSRSHDPIDLILLREMIERINAAATFTAKLRT